MMMTTRRRASSSSPPLAAPYFLVQILHQICASWKSSNAVPASSDLSNVDGAVQVPDQNVQLQEEAELESGRLGRQRLQHETTPERAGAALPDKAAAPKATMDLAPTNLQSMTTGNQASGVTDQGSDHWVPIRELCTTDQREERSSTKLKEHLRLSFLEIITATSVIINLFYIRRATEPISGNPSLIVASASAFVSLLSGFGLMVDTLRQMMSPGNLPRAWSKYLLCLSTMSLAFTVVTLIVSLLPKTYYYMPVVLVAALPVVAISFYRVHPRDDDSLIVGDRDPHKTDRKRSFQLAINMTTLSFMGALGTIIGHHKNASNRADHVYVKVSIFFMLGASLTGIVTLLLNLTMVRSWKDWTKTAIANAVMLGLLVPAVLMVGTTFLGGAIAAAAAFPVSIAAATWYIVEYHVPRDDDGGNDVGQQDQDGRIKPLYTVALTAMSVSFGTVMAIFAAFLGGEGKGENLEVCIFAVVSCFVSSVALGMVTFRTPKKASLGEAAKALGYLTLVLLVLAALGLVSYVG